jgi:Peptidase M50B-like
MDWVGEVWSRVLPEQGVALSGTPVVLVFVVALVAVAVEPLWRVLRLGVTLVHELGHASVGVLAGRRFTGFVLRGDMSGHAVTVGPARGVGRALTTWAGYPAPAVVGAAAVWLAVRGWSAPVLTVVLAVLVAAALRARSVLTVVVVAVAVLGAGALWWAGSPRLQAQVVVAVGVVLIVGAWRHLGAVLAAPDAVSSDRPPHPGSPRGVERDVRARSRRCVVARRQRRARCLRRARLNVLLTSGRPQPSPRATVVPWHTSTRSSRSARR